MLPFRGQTVSCEQLLTAMGASGNTAILGLLLSPSGGQRHDHCTHQSELTDPDSIIYSGKQDNGRHVEDQPTC
jgi:hypothetical protein